MSSFLKRLGRGIKGAITELGEPDRGETFSAGGKALACHQCGHEGFHEGSAQLNTAGMTFVGLDWANDSATTLACSRCGYVHWFVRPPRPT